MISIESGCLIMPEYQQEKRTKDGIGTGLVGLFVNLVLVVIKLVAGFIAGSVSILADAMNSLGDSASAILTIGGFYIANKPPDREHPYGHQRAEYISGLFTAIIILIVGFQFLNTSIQRIFNPTEVESSLLVIILLIVSILIKILLGIYYHQKNKKIEGFSKAIEALVKDSFFDVLINLVIIISYLIEIQTGWLIDGYIGAIVALLILHGGITTIIDTSNDLLGTRPDSELIDKMQGVLDSYSDLVGYHDLIFHKYGPNKIFATVDIEIDARWDIVEAHQVIDAIEKEFYKRFGIKLVGHIDPVELDDDELNEIHAIIKKLLKSYAYDFHFHDLRIEKEEEKDFIAFDVTVPNEVEESDEDLFIRITDDLAGKIQGFPFRIQFDRDYFLKE